ncbi:hypothetical protein LEMLEM_LOCUS26690, partial [Lemmus lemmus]
MKDWSDDSAPTAPAVLQRTCVQFPAPTQGRSQLPITPASGDLMPSSGLCGHPNTSDDKPSEDHLLFLQ